MKCNKFGLHIHNKMNILSAPDKIFITALCPTTGEETYIRNSPTSRHTPAFMGEFMNVHRLYVWIHLWEHVNSTLNPGAEPLNIT